jgi:hypothetical protein
LTPAADPKAIGHTAVIAMRNTTGAVPTPNATITIGAHAKGEIIRRKFTIGVLASSTFRKVPNKIPSGTPITTAMSKPANKRVNDVWMLPQPLDELKVTINDGTASIGPIRDRTGLDAQIVAVNNHHNPTAHVTVVIRRSERCNITAQWSRRAQRKPI